MSTLAKTLTLHTAKRKAHKIMFAVMLLCWQLESAPLLILVQISVPSIGIYLLTISITARFNLACRSNDCLTVKVCKEFRLPRPVFIYYIPSQMLNNFVV